MNYLTSRSFVDSTSIVSIAGNKLVVLSSSHARNIPQNFTDLLNPIFQPLAVGDPSHVPVGIYARSALQTAGIWGELQAHILPTMDATATIAIVARGEVSVGISYSSELFQRKDLQVAFTFADSLQPNITYSAALTQDASNKILAQQFIDFLISPTAQKVFSYFQLKPLTKSR